MLKIPRKKTIEEKPEKNLAVVLPLNTKHRGLDYIIELVKKIRPPKHRNIGEAERRFQSVPVRPLHHKRLPQRVVLDRPTLQSCALVLRAATRKVVLQGG